MVRKKLDFLFFIKNLSVRALDFAEAVDHSLVRNPFFYVGLVLDPKIDSDAAMPWLSSPLPQKHVEVLGFGKNLLCNVSVLICPYLSAS